MRRLSFLALLAGGAIALAACNQPAAAPEAPAAAPTAAELMAATPEALAPTLAPADAGQTAPQSGAPAAAGLRTFTIVPDQSKVSYKVGEVFFREGNRFNLAIGTTGMVEGQVMVDSANPSNSTIGPITVDISTFKSDSERRDNAIRGRWLESMSFPKATFKATKVEGVPADAKEGQALNLTVTGDLTVRDMTKPATFSVTATLQGDTLSGLASTEFNMSDYGVTVPDMAGMLKAEDRTQIEFSFVAKEQS